MDKGMGDKVRARCMAGGEGHGEGYGQGWCCC